MSRNTRILSLLNYRLKVTLNDGRVLVGQMVAFDRYMNLVLQECQELRTLKNGSTDQRTLGLVVLRGENIVSLSVEAPPPVHAEKVKLVQGPGTAKQAGRGLPIQGLMAPVAGVGGPAPHLMMPPGFPPPNMMPPPGFPAPPPGFRPVRYLTQGMMPPPGFRPPPPAK